MNCVNRMRQVEDIRIKKAENTFQDIEINADKSNPYQIGNIMSSTKTMKT